MIEGSLLATGVTRPNLIVDADKVTHGGPLDTGGVAQGEAW